MNTHTHTQPFYGSLDFVRDNPGEPVPEEAFTHSHLECCADRSTDGSRQSIMQWRSVDNNPQQKTAHSYVHQCLRYRIHTHFILQIYWGIYLT